MTAIIIAILTGILSASGWLAYGITLNVIRQRDEERERYKKALELMDAQMRESLELAQRNHDRELEEAWEESNSRYAQGKQEGKRATLDWIKRQVDEGALLVKVIGSPKK